MPSPEKQSPINKWEDSNMLSKIKVLPSDTSKTATWYQDRLLNSLLEKNSVEFNDLVNQEYIDINYFYGAPYNGTLLDIACRTRDMSEFVKSILEKEVDVNAINEITGKAAIHEAIENSAVDVVDILIQYGFLITIEDRDGNTPLHVAIKQNNLQIIKLLLENNHQRIDINISNRQNPTPLHIALLEGYTEAAIMLLKFSYIDLDFQTDSEGHTCRQIIHQRYPKLEEELHTNLTKIAADPVEILASLLKRGEIEIFIEVASKMSTKFLDDNEVCKYGGTFLQLACFYGYVDVVDMLLRKGVDPNKASIRTYIPILIAAKYGYYDIFVKLLNHPKIELKISGGESSLHQIIRGMFLLKHRDGSQHLKCLELLLNKIIPQAQLDIDYVNKEGYTALHYAVLLNDECVIKSLIYAGAHLYHKNSRGEIPLTSIKANILEDYLDQCISSRNNFFFARDFEITFDYTIFVQPSKFHQPEGHETEFFTIIEGVPELRMLLKHPVSKSFLHVKWYLVRKYYYINVIIYLIFCSILSWYIFQIHQGTWSPIINDSPILNTSSSNNDYTLYYGPSIIMIFNGVLVLRELSQFCVSPKTYIKSLENWMEILVILATCGLLALVNTDNANEQSPISAFIIIICWIELIFLLGKHPTFSNYIETFKTVTLNFLKYLSVYLLLIVSFAFSFYILFKSHAQLNNTSFKNQTNTTNEINIDFWQDPKLSFLKSIIMLTGEFSTED